MGRSEAVFPAPCPGAKTQAGPDHHDLRGGHQVADWQASSADRARAALRERWPDWEIWYVPRAIGGLLWCARLHSDHKALINAQSPDELEEYLAARMEQ